MQPSLRSSYTDFLSPFGRTLSSNTIPARLRHRGMAGQHIGNVMYYNIDDRRKEAELGITIGDKRYWSRGYGRDVQTFLRHLFTEAGLQRIYLNTLDWNVRAQQSFSRRALSNAERCGAASITSSPWKPSAINGWRRTPSRSKV